MMPCWAFGVTFDDKGSVKITDNNTEFAIETAEIIDEAESFDAMLRIIGKSKNKHLNFENFKTEDAIVSSDGRFVFQFNEEKDLLRCLKQLQEDPDILFAERDVPIFTAATEESYAPLSWGVSAIGADIYSENIADFIEDRVKTVAIVDSGCENIDFIKEKIVQGYDFVDNDTDATDDTSVDSHGTFLASIVADCTKSLPVKIMPVRVLSSKSGSLINAINGIYYAVDNGADVVNISLGGFLKDCSSLDDAVSYATKNNVSVVVCAGNAKSDIQNYCPAHIESAITVSSVNEKNLFSESFSNFGNSVDISAPGENIVGYNNLGEKVTLSGTSMSAAFVSAATTMCKLIMPDLSPEQIQNSLINATEDFGETGWDKYYGYGVLRLDKMPIPQKTHTVEWIVDGLTTCDFYKSNEKIMLPETPIKYGYIFDGWTPDVPDIMPDKSLTFTGRWIPVECEVIFDATTGFFEDGTTKKTKRVDFDEEISVPEAPSKPGYVFSGWMLKNINVGTDLGTMDDINGKTFTAVWTASTDTIYTVETYTMNTSGEYEKASQVFSGTTGETATAENTVPSGFSLNAEKSILSGTIAADNSLILKVYLDRNIYTFTTVVDGVSASTNYPFGSIVPEPIVPTKADYKFIKWDGIVPETMPAENVTVTAVFEKYYACPDCGEEILGEEAINEHIASETKVTISDGVIVTSGELKPSATITVSAPQVDGKIFSHWTVDGATVENSESSDTTIVLSSGKITITAEYEDCECKCHQGGIAGFFFKIVLFFQKLFGNNLECFCGKKH